jgi:type I restriction enzyme S subunit
VLSAYDDLIENNSRRINILEEMARALYREWFVNFRFPGHGKAKMVKSAVGPIPEGWTPTTLGDLTEDIRRSVNPAELAPDTPYLGLEHLPRRSIALSEWGVASQVQSTKLKFLKGEILFGKIRPYFHKVVVAPIDGVCSSDTIVICPKTTGVFGLVLGCVSSDAFVAHATQTSQGTKMPRANWDVLVKYPLPTPPKPLLVKFNDKMTELVELICNLVFQNRNLKVTRDFLLPRLISGEVDVGGLDIDTGSDGGQR